MPTPKQPLAPPNNRLLAYLDTLATAIGQCTAILVLLMMLITCLVVVLRYGFGSGSIALQESVTYLHGAVFLLGMGYTLKHQGHVRVDIFYRQFSRRRQAWVNCLGGIVFTLPFCGLIIGVSTGFVEASWAIREKSADSGGIPATFLLKTLIPIGAGLLALQTIAELLRDIPALLGRGESDQEGAA